MLTRRGRRRARVWKHQLNTTKVRDLMLASRPWPSHVVSHRLPCLHAPDALEKAINVSMAPGQSSFISNEQVMGKLRK